MGAKADTSGSGGWAGPERRQEKRARAELHAELRVGGRTYLGLIRDLSQQGAYLELIDRDPFRYDGDGVLLAPSLGGVEVPFAIRSKRSAPGDPNVRGVGVEFRDLPAVARERIAALLNGGTRRG